MPYRGVSEACTVCGAVGKTPHTRHCTVLNGVEAACEAHWNYLAENAPRRAMILPWDKVGPESKEICRQAMRCAFGIPDPWD